MVMINGELITGIHVRDGDAAPGARAAVPGERAQHRRVGMPAAGLFVGNVGDVVHQARGSLRRQLVALLAQLLQALLEGREAGLGIPKVSWTTRVASAGEVWFAQLFAAGEQEEKD